MSKRRTRTAPALVAVLALAASCGSGAAATDAASTSSGHPSPDKFTPRVDNRWFPLRPGTTFVSRGVRGGKRARDVVVVTGAKKTIDGVGCTVVKDRLYLDGRLHERTTDWYAQDRAGNVWYFGEATAELDANGKVKSTEGSFRSGVDGAQAGIYMPAHPRVGQTGRQEYYKGHAEDHFRVLSLHAHVRTPAASSRNALLTQETTPLEPGAIDHKLYVRGIGTAREEAIKGGTERLVLVSVRKH